MNVIPVVATIFGAAYAVQPAYGIGFSKDIYLWIPVLGNMLAVFVIPFVGNLSDKVGRKPPIIVGALRFRCCSPSAISMRSASTTCRWRSSCRCLMWGVVYQGYNAIFPSFYPELFPTRTRVSAMAISQNVGTTITALLPALFATVAPPGSANIPAHGRGDRLRHHGHCRTGRHLRRGKPTGSISTISAIPTRFRWARRNTKGSALKLQSQRLSAERSKSVLRSRLVALISRRTSCRLSGRPGKRRQPLSAPETNEARST